jgi:hypothetical protein
MRTQVQSQVQQSDELQIVHNANPDQQSDKSPTLRNAKLDTNNPSRDERNATDQGTSRGDEKWSNTSCVHDNAEAHVTLRKKEDKASREFKPTRNDETSTTFPYQIPTKPLWQ